MTVGRVKQQYDATYVPSAARSVHRVHKKGHVPKYALLQQVKAMRLELQHGALYLLNLVVAAAQGFHMLQMLYICF